MNQISKLTASDAQAGDWFGNEVDTDGTTAIAGAVRKNESSGVEGAAYLFE